MSRENFTTPVGRLVMGSLYKPQTTDAEGKPLTVKSGPNAGQAKVSYFFAVAIPKNPGEQHFSQTPWGQTIWRVGHTAFPQAAQSPSFAWKVVDGDSAVKNTKGVAPNTREGYPGNWVISFSSGFAPKIYNKDGTQAIVEPDAVKLGYFVQVNADVDGNGSQQKPGVYVNHSMVALSAYGPEIQVGRDPSEAGFGAAPLPAGAMAAPPAAFSPAPPPTPFVSGVPVGGFVPAGTVTPQPSTGFVLPVAVAQPVHNSVAPFQPQPNPAFLAIPPVPAAPVAQAGPRMTPKSGGATYEQMIAAGWTDALLIQHGHMLP